MYYEYAAEAADDAILELVSDHGYVYFAVISLDIIRMRTQVIESSPLLMPPEHAGKSTCTSTSRQTETGGLLRPQNSVLGPNGVAQGEV